MDQEVVKEKNKIKHINNKAQEKKNKGRQNKTDAYEGLQDMMEWKYEADIMEVYFCFNIKNTVLEVKES